MKAARLITGILVVALGAFLAWQGLRLRIDGDFGPGPGFFPFWIGLGLALLGCVWCARLAFVPAAAGPNGAFLPPPGARMVVASSIGALVAFMLLLRPLGFDLSMLALLLGLFFLIDRKNPVAKIVIAFAGSFGVHRVFETLLSVPLPDAALPILRQLGF